MAMKNAYNTSMKIFDQVSQKVSPILYEQLRGIGEGEVIVVKGEHDHVEKLLDTMQVPYQLIQRGGMAGINGGRVMIANCMRYSDKESAKAAKAFVNEGGRLVTTDWALDLMMNAFPGKLQKTASTGNDVVEIQCPTDIARNWIGMNYAQCAPQWWLEGSSDIYSIAKSATDVVPIITSEEMKQKYGQPYVTIGFAHGKGEAFHFISHLELQRTKTDKAKGTLDDFLQKMGATKTSEMDEVSMAELEAAYSTLNTLAHLCVPTPILNTGGKSTVIGAASGAAKSSKLA